MQSLAAALVRVEPENAAALLCLCQGQPPLASLYHAALACAAQHLPRFLAAPPTAAVRASHPHLLRAVSRHVALAGAGGRALQLATAAEAALSAEAYAAAQREHAERLAPGEAGLVESMGLGAKGGKVPWGAALALVAVFLAFLGVAEFNTSLSNLVPAINVAFVVGLLALGYLGLLPV
jgi:hypothetical protein